MPGLLDLLMPQQQPTSGLLNVPSGFDEQGFQNWIRNTDWFKEFVKEYKEGKLHSGKGGKVVKNPKQAIAIALSEAGKSMRVKK